MRRVVTLLLLATALAGCAQGEGTEEEIQAVPAGELHGVVVDESIQPLSGATVTARPSDATATTDANGSFVFIDLDPGTYTLTATRDGYLEATTIGSVVAEGESPVVKIVLPVDSEQLAYVSPYQFQGLFECGVWPESCTNVNIVTWIILCEAGACVGNVTQDRSIFLQWIDGIPDYLQTEMVWESTQPLGDNLGFAIGGATQEQLATGMADTYNYTHGPSSLLLSMQGQELAESGIGADRALLTQVVAGSTVELPQCVIYDPCGPGVQLMQPFETFTHAFYGFDPEPGWRFSETGTPAPPG